MKPFSVGIDFGGTRIKIGLVRQDKIIDKKIIAADSNLDFLGNLTQVKTELQKLLDKTDGMEGLAGIALAFPGLVDPVNKRVMSTNKKYDDATQLDIEAWFKQNWDVPFYIENDARMAAVGEWKFGSGSDTNNLVVMTIGTGIGTSAIIEGRLLRGKHFRAGCLGGHISINYNGRRCTCGNIGCLEAYGSAWSLKERADRERLTPSLKLECPFADFSTLFLEAVKNNPEAVSVAQEYMDVWATGIINLIHAYDPEVVVLGGGAMNSYEYIIPYITQRVECYAWSPSGKVQIRSSKLLSDAGILGAAYSLTNGI